MKNMDILNTLKSMENLHLFSVVGPLVHVPVHNKLLYLGFSLFQWYKDNNVKLKLPAFPKIMSLVGFQCEKELLLLMSS